MICILSIISIHKYIPSLFPISQTYGAFHYIHEMRRISQKHEQNISRFRIYTPVSEAMPQKLPGTVIVVIGESATRDRMKAFTPSYPSETTPWLSEMKETPYFYLMDKTYSCFPVTVPALSMFLYGRNQYDHRNIDDVANIIDVAHLSGYKTWWMSNQGKMSGEDSPIDFVAQNCDTEQRTPFPLGDDYQLLDFVKQLPKTKITLSLSILWAAISDTATAPRRILKESTTRSTTSGPTSMTPHCFTQTAFSEISIRMPKII